MEFKVWKPSTAIDFSHIEGKLDLTELYCLRMWFAQSLSCLFVLCWNGISIFKMSGLFVRIHLGNF